MMMAVEKGNEELRYAALWLLSYLFLLRVPSEVSYTKFEALSGSATCACRPCRAVKGHQVLPNSNRSRP